MSVSASSSFLEKKFIRISSTHSENQRIAGFKSLFFSFDILLIFLTFFNLLMRNSIRKLFQLYFII